MTKRHPVTVHNQTLVVKPTFFGEYLRGCIVLLALSATVQAAFESVLKQVGATMPHRDSLDARIVEEARTGTARFGGTYGDGYTNLEEFLNGTDPTVFVNYTQAENNVNTLR